MRTLLLVVLMMVMALASGLSFVLHAAAQAPASAELTVDCGDQLAVASATPTLVTCAAVARNTGSTTVADAKLELKTAIFVQGPDRYFSFWSETHDGVRSIPDKSQFMFDFGDIPSGASSKIVFEIIAQSTEDFGVDFLLVSEPDHHPYGHAAVRCTVDVSLAPAAAITLVRDYEVTPTTTSASYRLAIMNRGETPYERVTAELSPGTDVLITSDAWQATALPGRMTADFGALAGYSSIRQLSAIAAVPRTCSTADPELVVTLVEGGVTRRQPVLGDEQLVGDCPSQVTGSASLPRGGSGPSGRDARVAIRPAALAVVGALCLGMGLTMRWRRRGLESTGRFRRR